MQPQQREMPLLCVAGSGKVLYSCRTVLTRAGLQRLCEGTESVQLCVAEQRFWRRVAVFFSIGRMSSFATNL